MPRWARTIGEALPLTHMVKATRGVLLKGESAARVATEMIPVAMFAMIAPPALRWSLTADVSIEESRNPLLPRS